MLMEELEKVKRDQRDLESQENSIVREKKEEIGTLLQMMDDEEQRKNNEISELKSKLNEQKEQLKHYEIR